MSENAQRIDELKWEERKLRAELDRVTRKHERCTREQDAVHARMYQDLIQSTIDELISIQICIGQLSKQGDII